MHIRDLRQDDTTLIEQVAELLVERFREMAPDAWPTLEEARRGHGLFRVGAHQPCRAERKWRDSELDRWALRRLCIRL
jgi:hypothetical protein